jgi:hypothetical protein
MIQGCRYLRRSTNRWLLSKNSTIEGLKNWHGAGLLWNCSIPITTLRVHIYTLALTRLLVDHDYNIYCLKLTSWRHVRLAPVINSSLLHIQATSSRISRMLPLSSMIQFFCRTMMYSRPQTPLPNALRKIFFRMVLFYQTRPIGQSLPCTKFWCKQRRFVIKCS